MARKRGGQNKTCPVCGKVFYVKPSNVSKSFYCSVKCRGIGQTEKNTKEVTCKHCGKKFKKPLSQIKTRDDNFCSQKCFQGHFSLTQRERKDNLSKQSMSRKGMVLKLDRLWRKIVHSRPDECEFCGQTKDNYNAHHIKGRRHMATRFDLDNASKVCIGCHFKIHDNSVDNYNFVTKLRKERGEDWWNELQKKSNKIVKWSEKDLEAVYDELLKHKTE